MTDYTVDLFTLQRHIYWREIIAQLIKLLIATTIYIASKGRLFNGHSKMTQAVQHWCVPGCVSTRTMVTLQGYSVIFSSLAG